MSFLFGHLYDSPCTFTHDQMMLRKTGGDARVFPRSESGSSEDRPEEPARKSSNYEQGACTSSSEALVHNLPPDATKVQPFTRGYAELVPDYNRPKAAPVALTAEPATKKRRRSEEREASELLRIPVQVERRAADDSAPPVRVPQVPSAAPSVNAPSLTPYDFSEAWKQQAFEAASGTGSSSWNDIALVSVSGHQEREEEL